MNIVKHTPSITRKHRNTLNNHRSFVIWFTGLSGSGKSTIAHELEKKLYNLGCRSYVLDGDNIRHGLTSDLGFCEEDRRENIRRVGEVAKLMVDSGVVVLTAFISPFESDRKFVRSLFKDGDFIEVYCKADIKTCEMRDVKGLYKKARNGEIKNYTGIDSPYQVPSDTDLVVDTYELSVNKSVLQVLELIKQKI